MRVVGAPCADWRDVRRQEGHQRVYQEGVLCCWARTDVRSSPSAASASSVSCTTSAATRTSPGELDRVDPADRSLYDMDIVFDPPGSGMFNEVYLYEELMEADLHAIVSHCPGAALTPDPLRPAAVGRALPELHLPDAVRVEGALRSRPLLTSVHPLGQRSPPRLKARKPARQRRLRAQDLRLWPRAWLPARCCADRAGAGRLHDRV